MPRKIQVKRPANGTNASLPPNRGPAKCLIVDDNSDLLRFLARLMGDAGWIISTAETAAAGRRMMRDKPDAVLLDYLLPDGNGIELGVEFHKSAPQAQVIVMTGVPLTPADEALCEDNGFSVLRKPFLASEVMRKI